MNLGKTVLFIAFTNNSRFAGSFALKELIYHEVIASGCHSNLDFRCFFLKTIRDDLYLFTIKVSVLYRVP